MQYLKTWVRFKKAQEIEMACIGDGILIFGQNKGIAFDLTNLKVIAFSPLSNLKVMTFIH